MTLRPAKRGEGARSADEGRLTCWSLMFDIVEEQRVRPPDTHHRFEGIAFSPDGGSIAVATSESNTVCLYRHANGRVAEEPFATIQGARSGLKYPHDVAFSAAGDLMAVALRNRAITVYERRGEGFRPEPAFVIRGFTTRLNFSDGVAFVGDHLAACNLESDSVSFYRMTSRAPLAFELTPSFELKDESIYQPDGLCFSEGGRWLAVANHGKHTVAVFERDETSGLGPQASDERLSDPRSEVRGPRSQHAELRYGPKPVSLLRHRTFRYPHSVAFTPATNHLFVTNAGANYFSVFAHERGRWSRSPAVRHVVGPERAFHEVNARSKLEGGPKGIAIHANHVAICSPEQGIVMYTLRES
jgi:DNA-binding beta-propeller fold protein YncE